MRNIISAMLLLSGVALASHAADDERPLSFYSYSNDRVKLLPRSDKGLTDEDVMRTAKNKSFAFGRPRPEPQFRTRIEKTDDGAAIELETVPVELLEDAGISRDAVVRFGFPLPEGALRSLENIKLADADGKDLAAQFAATAFWKDKSLKWVLIQSIVPLKAGERKSINVVFGRKVSRQAPASKLKMSETKDEFVICTGPLKAVVDKKR